MKTILVTGGAGYVGSHCCKALAMAGYNPVTYDNLERGHKWAVKWGPFEKGDILERDRLNEVLQKYSPEAVIHFAAYAYVEESVNYPDKYYRNNVEGSLNLLEVMQLNGVKNIVFSSSCAVYGLPQEHPVSENHPVVPINPYGAGKLSVEKKLEEYAHNSTLKYISLRYFNAAGADPDGETGELHEPETHLIPLVLATAGSEQLSININGDDYDTRDGTCIRDYVHVCDLADGHIKALQYIEHTGRSAVINLGSGIGYSVNEVIKTAEDVTNLRIRKKIAGRRAGDPSCLIANIAYAKKMLGWQPIRSKINHIVETAWNWKLKAVNID